MSQSPAAASGAGEVTAPKSRFAGALGAGAVLTSFGKAEGMDSNGFMRRLSRSRSAK